MGQKSTVLRQKREGVLGMIWVHPGSEPVYPQVSGLNAFEFQPIVDLWKILIVSKCVWLHKAARQRFCRAAILKF